MKTIIEKNNGYAVTEWVEPEEAFIPPYPPYGMDSEEYHFEVRQAEILAENKHAEWQQLLASQPSTPVHPDHTQWAKENLYQPMEDDRIEIREFEELIVPPSGYTSEIYAKPKQPVEVKEEQIQYENGEWSRDVYPEPVAALPVEKESDAREIIASFLFRNFSTDLEPIEDMVSARLMADSLICQLPTAPPAEDWVSVEDAMPTESDFYGIIPVLCKDENAEPPYNYPFVAFRHGSRSKDFSLAHESCTNAPVKVTHWKHLNRKK